MLYDTREGNYRDDPANAADLTLTLGGMMNYVALDVGNLKKMAGGDGSLQRRALQHRATGTVNNQSGSGYIVYFSDRRGNKCDPAVTPLSCPTALVPVETGEYGFEDFVNPLQATGLPVSTTLDVGEDVNASIAPVAPAAVCPRARHLWTDSPEHHGDSTRSSNARPWTSRPGTTCFSGRE